MPHTVIGVLPAGGAFDRAFAQIWRPLAFEPENMTRNFHWFGALAKLKRGVTLKQATAQMDAIGARIAKDYPDSNKGWGVSIEPFADTVVGTQLRQSLYVLLSAVGMVLLIGCANLANLTLARGTSREREVAIRASVGAGRWRLVRQFLTENVLLSVCGGVLGLALGTGAQGRTGAGGSAVFPAPRGRCRDRLRGCCYSPWRSRSSPASFSDWLRRFRRRGRTWRAA